MVIIYNLTRTYSCLISWDSQIFLCFSPPPLLDVGHAWKNALATISDITQSQGTHLEREGKVVWELKVFVEKKRRPLTSNQHSSSSSYPNYWFTQEDLKFLHRQTPQHCSMKYCRRSWSVREGAAFANGAPHSCTEDTWISRLYPSLPQSVVSGFEVSIQTISIFGGKCVPFLVSSH